jgi:hypothetical protein
MLDGQIESVSHATIENQSDFFAACAVFENRQEAFSKERLEAVLDAVERLRQNGSGAR